MRAARLGVLLCLVAARAAASGAGASEGASEGDAAPPGAQPGCAEQLAVRVQQRYERIRDLSARFEQVTERVSLGGAGAPAEIARGVVTLAKPGRMRWSYREPEPSLLVSDGDTVWTYDPGLGEVQRFAVTAGLLEGAAVQFLLGRGRILEEFDVRGGPCDAETAELVLVPKEDASYQRLDITVETETGRVTGTSVWDLFGNVTRVRFADIRTDQDPPPETFVFEPPPGARVLDVGPPTQ